MRAAPELDNLLDAGTNFRNEPDGKDGHIHPDAVGGFDYFDTLFKICNRYFEARVNIKNIKRGKLFTDVTQIKDVTQAIMSSYGDNPKSQFLRTSSMDSIRDPEEDVNGKNSLSSNEDTAPVARDGEVYGRDIGIDAPVQEDLDSENVPDSDTDGMEAFDAMLDEIEIRGTRQRLDAIREHSQQELEANQKYRQEAKERYDQKIAKAQQQYDAKKNKESKYAQPHTVHIL